VTTTLAHAKVNLALVVGPTRPDGKHELLTLYQRVELADEVAVEPAGALSVEGFAEDTLVRGALEALAAAARVKPRWAVRLEKRIPVAAGLGGGSSDAAAALELANETLETPLSPSELHAVAAQVGADVPFFLAEGPQLGSGDGTTLQPVELPQEYAILLLLPHAAAKTSTADVYGAFDARRGAEGWDDRRRALHAAVESVRAPRDLGALPPNDLASSPVAVALLALGAFRADVSGAGPALYGLFDEDDKAAAAGTALEARGRVWVTRPAW
jgi:4-diphosphocytidyl-2-C-methyl-D-erythritol kinase